MTAREINTWWLSLGCIVLIAAVMRVYALDFQSLWLNELDSWWMSQHESLGQILGRDIMHDPHPQGYQFLLYFVIHYLGESEHMLRMLSVVSGVLAVFFVGLLGRRLFDSKTGLFAAALMAVSWAPIYYAQEARAYSSLIMTATLSTLLLVMILQRLEASKEPGWKVQAGYVVVAASMCYLHYFGILIVGFHALMMLLRMGITRRAIMLLVGVGVLYLPWLPSILADLQVESHRIPPATILAFPSYYLFAFNQSFVIALIIAVPMHTLACVDGLKGIFKSSKGWRTDPTLLLVLWILLPMLVVFIKSQVSLPVMNNRNLLICLPPLYLLAARGVCLLRGPRLSLGVGVLAVSAICLHLVMMKKYYETPTKTDYRGLVWFIVNTADYQQLPLVGGRFSYYYNYYFKRFGSDRSVIEGVYTGEDKHKVDAVSKAAPSGQFWLITSTLYQPDADLARHLQSNYEIVYQQDLFRTWARVYQPKRVLGKD